MGLMCLEHVVADFYGTFDIFTEKHRGADFTLDNIFASDWIFLMEHQTFRPHHNDNGRTGS